MCLKATQRYAEEPAGYRAGRARRHLQAIGTIHEIRRGHGRRGDGEWHRERAGLPPAVTETLTAVVASLMRRTLAPGHSQKVASYAVILAEALGMPAQQVEEIRLAALLHDIGKIGIPDSVIQKNGPLDPAEWELMQQHVRYGARILQPFPEIAAVREMVEHHHEFFDGSGYPDGQSGEAISLGARILALCDAYDTITSERSYQRGRGAEEAFTRARALQRRAIRSASGGGVYRSATAAFAPPDRSGAGTGNNRSVLSLPIFPPSSSVIHPAFISTHRKSFRGTTRSVRLRFI